MQCDRPDGRPKVRGHEEMGGRQPIPPAQDWDAPEARRDVINLQGPPSPLRHQAEADKYRMFLAPHTPRLLFWETHSCVPVNFPAGLQGPANTMGEKAVKAASAILHIPAEALTKPQR